ncbi:MAG TPA: carboxypeptidase-like regulatory domain-containing protein [Gemmatimonadaceae bacterium]
MIDSVRGGYLRDAIVSISGTQLSASTDSLGRFHIDSIPAGMHAVRLLHPILDTLGISVTTASREFSSGSRISLILSIPSPGTIVERKCSIVDRKLGDAALAGVVVEAETESPASGAEVHVAWTDIRVDKKTIVKTPQRRAAKVRSDGSFLICGIPSDLQTGVVASRGGDSTAAVPVDFGRGIVLQTLYLPGMSALTTPGRADRRVNVTGKVVDGNGKPIAGARVAIDADDAVTNSRADGSFDLLNVRAGSRMATARKIGLEPVEISINVSPSKANVLTVQMKNTVRVLEAVKVTALRNLGLQRVGFTERQKWGMGKMFTPEDIERRNPLRLNYLLEAAPMLRTGATSDGKRYITGRFNGCVRYFVDGWLTTEASPLDLENLPNSYLSTAEIGAVEVYSPLSVPPQFFAMSRSGNVCSVVVIWTKFKLGVR